LDAYKGVYTGNEQEEFNLNEKVKQTKIKQQSNGEVRWTCQ
jgi:hypothetical protein